MARSYTMAEIRRIAQRLADGASSAEVAAEFGRTPDAIYAVAGRHRHLFPRRDPVSNRRIDDAQAKAMRDAGMKLPEIAAAFGATIGATHKAIRRAA